MHGHHEATIRLAGVTLGRELRALALSHTAPVRRATAGELGHEVACRQRPHSASGRLHRGHQLVSEERTGCLLVVTLHRVPMRVSERGAPCAPLDERAELKRQRRDSYRRKTMAAGHQNASGSVRCQLERRTHHPRARRHGDARPRASASALPLSASVAGVHRGYATAAGYLGAGSSKLEKQ